jgi:hypothetical protein
MCDDYNRLTMPSRGVSPVCEGIYDMYISADMLFGAFSAESMSRRGRSECSLVFSMCHLLPKYMPRLL